MFLRNYEFLRSDLLKPMPKKNYISGTHSIMPNDRIINELGFGRKWLWHEQGTIPPLFWRDMRKTIKPLSQDCWCSTQDSNHALPEYKHTALSLDQHIQMLVTKNYFVTG